MPLSSALSPDHDMAMMASSLAIMPRSPWIGFRRMHEEGRRAGRGQRGGDLGADMPAFADAGDDDAAPDRRDQFYGAGKSIGKPVVQGFGKRGYSGLLGGDGSQR